MPQATIVSQACQLLVALAEEGWTEGKIASLIVHQYLRGLFEQRHRWPQTVVLGCTHFPLLVNEIKRAAIELGATATTIIDPSIEIAKTVANAIGPELQSGLGKTTYLATDNPSRFASIGGQFLGQDLESTDIQLVDLKAI